MIGYTRDSMGSYRDTVVKIMFART